VNASGWDLLYPNAEEEKRFAVANLRRSLERLPAILEMMM